MSPRFPVSGLALGIIAFGFGCTVRNIIEVTVGSVEVYPSAITILEGETQRLTAQLKDEFGQELPSGNVTWSSDAPSVFSIDENTAEGQALGPGQATIWATRLGTRGSASVSVEPGPSIVISEPSLLFSGTVGGKAGEPITLQITNGGGGSVGGISAAVQYPEGATAGWLSLALDGTSAPTTLTLSSQLRVLEEGVYDATLVLMSEDARNSPATVAVEAVITLDRPIIGLSAGALEFRVEAGSILPDPQTVQVTNQGGGVLSDLEATPLYTAVGGWLSVSLTGTTAPTELLVQPGRSGLRPGIYIAEVRVTGPGALNTPLSMDVSFTIEVGVVSPANSTATVPAGTVGLPTNLVVQARNASGNPLSSGGASVVVTVSGANATEPITATDVGDGTYTASYTPTVAGTDEVAITMDGTPLGGSPFLSLVSAGSAVPPHSTATIPAETAGLPTSIVVQARDENGNPLSSGGATVVVTVSGANEADPIPATDASDGTYTASYTPILAGTDEVAITMDGTPLGESPFISVVSPGSASPTHSTATVPAGTVGTPTNIVVQARDENGNALSSGGATVVMTVLGADAAELVTATDAGDGTYTASYTPTAAGADEVAITMDGTPLGDSPFISVVSAGSAVPANSTATVPAGTAGLPTKILAARRQSFPQHGQPGKCEPNPLHGHGAGRDRRAADEHCRPGTRRVRQRVELRGRHGGRDGLGGRRVRAHPGHRCGRWHLYRQLHAHRCGYGRSSDHRGRHAARRQSFPQPGQCRQCCSGAVHGQRAVRKGEAAHEHRRSGP